MQRRPACPAASGVTLLGRAMARAIVHASPRSAALAGPGRTWRLARDVVGRFRFPTKSERRERRVRRGQILGRPFWTRFGYVRARCEEILDRVAGRCHASGINEAPWDRWLLDLPSKASAYLALVRFLVTP